MKPLIGIDLGTTNSLVAVFRDGLPHLIPNAFGEQMTPSAVGILHSGEVLIGRPACELAISHPGRVATSFKRLMGTERKVQLAGRAYSAPELSSLVLASLKRDAEVHLGVPVEAAVITVPAYFNQLQRADTKRAAALAGLEVLRIVNEPTAAALAYGLDGRGSDRTLLVFDLGGGTFDVTVMDVFEGTLEILATAGESRLGGEDFTAAVTSHALRTAGLNLEQAELDSPLRVARLQRFAEQAKRDLCSTAGPVELPIPDEHGEIHPDALRVTVDQDLFERLVEPLRQRLSAPLERALADARKSWRDIAEVLLVGGATRMPLVHRLVEARAGRAPRTALHPDHAVALGAAVQAALIADDSAVAELVMTDVCPFSLGVEVAKDMGARLVEGYFLPVIHRNTTIPTSREEIVTTIVDGQTSMSIEVFQGEARRTEENVQLGRLKVVGIPSGPKGQKVALRFTYDLNGLLEVETIVEATGARHSLVLRNLAVEMSDKEFREAQSRLADLKFYPRDDSVHRDLLLYAEACVKEVARHLRELLEVAVDRYERALTASTRDDFTDSREALLQALVHCGFEYPRGDGR